VPLAYDRDDAAIADAIGNAGVIDERLARLVWIKNTLDLEYICISKPIWECVSDRSKFQAIPPVTALPFDPNGNLPFGIFNRKATIV
jgi:hypothetical protein